MTFLHWLNVPERVAYKLGIMTDSLAGSGVFGGGIRRWFPPVAQLIF